MLPKQVYPLILLAVALSSANLDAASAPLTLRVTMAGEAKTVSVESAEVRGARYISVADLVHALGGATRPSAASRLEAQLDDRTVVLTVSDTRVSTTDAPFYLKLPVVQQEGRVYIALDDVAGFLESAFPTAANTTAAPPQDALEGGQVSMQDLLPSEPVSPAAPGLTAGLQDRPVQTGPLSTIILDAGHGGQDAGNAGEPSEKDLTLLLVQQVAEALKQKSKLSIRFTREDDSYLSSQERSFIATENKGDLLVSLHAGASLSPQARGFEIFYAAGHKGAARTGLAAVFRGSRDYTPQSQRAAMAIAQAMSASLNVPSRGVREAPLRFLNDLSMPALLIEVGQMTNPQDHALLASPTYQRQLAEAIAAGIIAVMEG